MIPNQITLDLWWKFQKIKDLAQIISFYATTLQFQKLIHIFGWYPLIYKSLIKYWAKLSLILLRHGASKVWCNLSNYFDQLSINFYLWQIASKSLEVKTSRAKMRRIWSHICAPWRFLAKCREFGATLAPRGDFWQNAENLEPHWRRAAICLQNAENLEPH